MRRVLSVGLGICLLAAAVLAGPAVGEPFSQLMYRLNNPHSRGDKELVIVQFLANQNRGGRTTSIPADNVFGVKTVEHADLVVEVSLSCDPPRNQSLITSRVTISPTFYVVRGNRGFGAIPVHNNRFRFATRAYDGNSRQGQLVFSGTFSHRGLQVAGSISVNIPTFRGAPNDPFTGMGTTYTNCKTAPGGNPAKLGKSLPFHIRAAG